MFLKAGKTSALLLALAVMLIAAGCGGDGDDTTVVLTKGQFVKQADKFCNQARQAALSTPEGVKDPIQENVLPELQSAADKLAGLAPPSEDAAQVEKIVKALQADIDSAIAAGVPDLPQLEDHFADSAKLARAYGIAGCAYAA